MKTSWSLLGHSSWYLRLAGKRILIDPVFSDYAAPFSFINKAFPGDYPWNAQRMPEIDLLIISHDHYDHLDYATIKSAMPKVKRVVTPLIGSHLRYWGMDAAIIDEVDWNQTIKISDELCVHALPARHFLRPWAETQPDLMGQLPVRHPQERFITAAIAAMARIFKAIGEQFGPIDLAIMEKRSI